VGSLTEFVTTGEDYRRTRLQNGLHNRPTRNTAPNADTIRPLTAEQMRQIIYGRIEDNANIIDDDF